MAKVDRGGRWHATIPRKGNRWIDMPDRAMGKLGDLLERDFDAGGAEEQETVAWARDYEKIVTEDLEDGNVEAAQTHVQEVLDTGLLDELGGEMEGGISEDDTADSLNPAGIQEALQAFVDIDPDDFRELAQASEVEGDSEDGDEAEPEPEPVQAAEPESEPEPTPEPTEVDFKDLMKIDYRTLGHAVSAYWYFNYGTDDFPEHLQKRGSVPGKKAMQPDDPKFGEAALAFYVGEGNGGDYINQALRGTLKDFKINPWNPEERMPEDQQARMVEVAEAAEKYVADNAVELPEDSMLYRGIELKALEQLDLTPGAQIPMSGLFSTTASRKIGEDFAHRRKWVKNGKPGALIEIVAPKGSKVTSAHVKEEELILQPGDLEILSVDTSGKVPVIRASYKPAASAKDDKNGIALQSDDPKDTKSKENLGMKTSKIGAFVKIDAGGQWHATIPEKGNRWIDMPGAAMAELYDMVAKAGSQGGDYDGGPGSKADEDDAVIEDSLAQIQEKNKAVHELLEKGDEQGVTEAQGIAQEVLDNFPWEDYSGETTSYVEDEAGEEVEEDSAETIREALQAFVDIDPAEFLEQASAGKEEGESADAAEPDVAEAGDAEPAEGAPEGSDEPAPAAEDFDEDGDPVEEDEDFGELDSDVPANASPAEIRKQIAALEKSSNTWQGGDTETASRKTKANKELNDAEIEELENLLPKGEPKTLAELKKKVAEDKAPTEENIREVIDFLHQGYLNDSDYKLLKQLQGKLAEARGFDPQKPVDKGGGRKETDLGNGWTMIEDDPKGTWGGYRSFRDPANKESFDQSGTSEYLDREQALQVIGANILEKERLEKRQAEIMGGVDEEYSLKSESREDRASLVASGKTKRKLAAPVKPPAAWFENPNFKMGTPLTVTKEGRVFGHLALWGTCHAAFANASGDCIVVPGSNADYAMFHLGVVETEEGNEVPVGRLAMETTHADDQFSSRRAIAHYENTGLAIADIHCGEDEFGIWFSGALRPDATESQIRSLKASPLSGDWRYYPQTNDLELVMALAVNMPGFAVPRPQFMVASGQVRSLVAAGILAPKQIPRAKVERAKAGDQLAIDDIKYLQKLAARGRANEAKILKQRALVASGAPNKIHALAQKLMKPTSVEEKK